MLTIERLNEFPMLPVLEKCKKRIFYIEEYDNTHYPFITFCDKAIKKINKKFSIQMKDKAIYELLKLITEDKDDGKKAYIIKNEEYNLYCQIALEVNEGFHKLSMCKYKYKK